jgi:hypothetical protein
MEKSILCFQALLVAVIIQFEFFSVCLSELDCEPIKVFTCESFYLFHVNYFIKFKIIPQP